VSRYRSTTQDPTLCELIDLGADDNLDLIMAQLFTTEQLGDLVGGLRDARDAANELARDASREASIWGQNEQMREFKEEQAEESALYAIRLGVLIEAIEGPR
jgi:hypothetical protein